MYKPNPSKVHAMAGRPGLLIGPLTPRQAILLAMPVCRFRTGVRTCRAMPSCSMACTSQLKSCAVRRSETLEVLALLVSLFWILTSAFRLRGHTAHKTAACL